MTIFFCSIYYPVDMSTGIRTPDESKWSLLLHFDVTDTVKFDTQLHGGFSSAEFLIDRQDQIEIFYQRSMLGLSVIITDQVGNRVFEGSVERTSIEGDRLRFSCAGHYQKGKYKFFDMIYSYMPGTTNLCICPSFEVANKESIVGWSGFTYNKGSMLPTLHYIALVPGTVDLPAKYGSKFVRIFPPGTESKYDYTFYTQITAIPYVTEYTFSFYIRYYGLPSAPYVQVTQNFDPTNILAQATISGMVKNEWVRWQITATVDSPTTVEFYITVPNIDYIQNSTGNISAHSIDIDGAQVEAKTYATPYCDGDQTASYWNGAPNISTSTRDQEYGYLWEMVKDAVEAMNKEWNPLFEDYPAADFLHEGKDFTNVKVSEAIEGLLKGGYEESDVTPAYFAIWNNSTPYLIKPPNDNDYTWYVPSGSLSETSKDTEYSIDNVFNKVWAIYSTISGEPSKTETAAEDFISQLLYGEREGLLQVQESGSLYDVALQLRDLSLARNKDPKQTRTVEITGPVQDANGRMYPHYLIRAGDTVLIPNYNDYSTMYASIYASGGYKTYQNFITKTEYTAETGIMRLYFSDTDTYMESIFARLGADGGLE